MKNYSRILITLLFTILSFHLKAQAILGLTTTSVSNSSPNIGDQLYIFATLKNFSLTDTFSNIIGFEVANKDSILTSTITVGKPPYTNTLIKLAPQEEKSALFTLQMFSNTFVAGPDIIIVWPIVMDPNIFITDSAEAPINIVDPLYISDKEDALLQHYVFNELLFINNINQENMLEQVQIFNAFEQLLIEQKIDNKPAIVSLEKLTKGIYYGYITFRNKKQLVIKIFYH
jgi:hypothetical protein